MPRKEYDKSTDRIALRDFRRRHPILTGSLKTLETENLKKETVEKVENAVCGAAATLCEECHSADVSGMMLRLNNILHDAIDSLIYVNELATKERAAEAEETRSNAPEWLQKLPNVIDKKYMGKFLPMHRAYFESIPGVTPYQWRKIAAYLRPDETMEVNGGEGTYEEAQNAE